MKNIWDELYDCVKDRACPMRHETLSVMGDNRVLIRSKFGQIHMSESDIMYPIRDAVRRALLEIED